MNIRELRGIPEVWRILDRRAQDLAARESADDASQGEEVLAFRLGDGNYTLPARYVLEVQPLGSYTPLPSTPSFVVGLVNVRGRLLAALDIRPLLDIPQTPLSDETMLLIVTASGMEVGLIADIVLEVRRSDQNLAMDPSAAAGRGVNWIRGVDRQLSLLLDPPLLLADPRLIVDEGAA